MSEVGYVTQARNYLLTLDGLPSVRINDVLIGPHQQKALVTSLEDQSLQVIQLTAPWSKPGEEFGLLAGGLKIPASGALLGRVINPLGEVFDGGKFLPCTESLNLMVEAKGIAQRETVSEQLFTGLTVVDTLLPVGKGQRELIFGEPRSGKISFILDIIRNQRETGAICIYAALGKEEVEVKRFSQQVSQSGTSGQTIIVAATSAEGAALTILAPLVALSIAESFACQGQDVILFLDDLGVHAKYLREIALLSGRVPGRESYPGDVFFQHAQLVERAGNFNQQAGGGSITLFPVIEAELENLSGFIPTNVMSATDGHLLFSSRVQTQVGYPAINIAESVTRVGRQTQTALQQELSQRIQAILAEHSELEKFSRFDTELSAETRLRLHRGEVLHVLLRQRRGMSLSFAVQVMLLSLPLTPFFENKNTEYVKSNYKCLVETLSKNKEFVKLASRGKEYNLDSLQQELTKCLAVLAQACQ